MRLNYIYPTFFKINCFVWT